jgi:hypothetical protein
VKESDLEALIDEATMDAYGLEEASTGFYTVLVDELDLPFRTEVLGVAVTVTELDLPPGGPVTAICKAGRSRQRVGLLDLPLPDPLPSGSEWIDAYRLWSSRL